MVLSADQAKAIQKNWANVKAHAQKVGNDLFIRSVTHLHITSLSIKL
jgi:hypothetical protein